MISLSLAPQASPRPLTPSSQRLCALRAVGWEGGTAGGTDGGLGKRYVANLTGLCAKQILTPAPDNLLAKRLAEKESMTSISVGNGLDTPAGMRYLSAPSSTLSVCMEQLLLWGAWETFMRLRGPGSAM